MLVAWILGLCVAGAGSRPSARDLSSGMDWLTRYGYLPPPDPYSAQQQTLDGLREAVKTMQRFAGLRQTGILDDDTIAMMHKPRCSLPDILLASGYQRHRRKRYAVSGSVWQKSHLTWRVDSFPVSLSQATTRQLIGSALYTWSRESNLDFEETRAGDADIRVSFVEGSHGDGYPFDGPGGTLGHAFFPGVGSSAGATHMDADESWTYNVDEGTDLFAVAVHEFGHSLGLSHSSAENSIMKPYYQGTVGEHQRYRLPPDDVQGIQALYGYGNGAGILPNAAASQSGIGKASKAASGDLNSFFPQGGFGKQPYRTQPLAAGSLGYDTKNAKSGVKYPYGSQAAYTDLASKYAGAGQIPFSSQPGSQSAVEEDVTPSPPVDVGYQKPGGGPWTYAPEESSYRPNEFYGNEYRGCAGKC